MSKNVIEIQTTEIFKNVKGSSDISYYLSTNGLNLQFEDFEYMQGVEGNFNLFCPIINGKIVGHIDLDKNRLFFKQSLFINEYFVKSSL